MPQVICLGEILVDRIAQADGEWQDYPGGAPANVAVNLAKLGISVGMVGCVGTDPQGLFLRQFLSEQGVDTSQLHDIPPAQTRQIFLEIDESGERNFTKTIGNADLFLAPHLLSSGYFASAEYLVLGTSTLAHPQSSRAIGRALKLAEEHFLKVVVDINWRPLFWGQPQQATALIPLLIKHADFLKMTTAESHQFFRTSSPAAIVQQFHHLEGVIITAGAKGCSYYLGGRQSRCPALPITAIDTTGAGDAFLAGFLAELTKHSLSDLQKPEIAHQLIKTASAVGAIATTTMGAIHPDLSWQAIAKLLSD